MGNNKGKEGIKRAIAFVALWTFLFSDTAFALRPSAVRERPFNGQVTNIGDLAIDAKCEVPDACMDMLKGILNPAPPEGEAFKITVARNRLEKGLQAHLGGRIFAIKRGNKIIIRIQEKDATVVGSAMFDLVMPLGSESFPEWPPKEDLTFADDEQIEREMAKLPPEIVGKITRTPGGPGQAEAIVLALLGAKVKMVARLGDDPYADELIAHMKKNGVDVSGVKKTPGRPTAKTYIPSGQAIVDGKLKDVTAFSHAMGADDALAIADLSDEDYRVQVFHVGGVALTPKFMRNSLLTALTRAKEEGAVTVMDTVVDKLSIWLELEKTKVADQICQHLDVLTISKKEVAQYTDLKDPAAIVKYFLAKGVKTVIYKMGDEGCMVGSRGSPIFADTPLENAAPVIIKMPVYRKEGYKPIDTTGMGDAFSAAFSSAILRGYSLGDTVALATGVASLAGEQIGGGNIGPMKEEGALARLEVLKQQEDVRAAVSAIDSNEPYFAKPPTSPEAFIENRGTCGLIAPSLDAETLIKAIIDARCPWIAAEIAFRGGDREATLQLMRFAAEYKRRTKNTTTIIAAGTVLNVDDALAAIDAGAVLIVTPALTLTKEEIQRIHNMGAKVVLGVASGAEAIEARGRGADATKAFPYKPKKGAYLEAVKGPMPQQHHAALTYADMVEEGNFAIGTPSALFEFVRTKPTTTHKFILPSAGEDLVAEIREAVPGWPIVVTGGVTTSDLIKTDRRVGAALSIKDAAAVEGLLWVFRAAEEVLTSAETIISWLKPPFNKEGLKGLDDFVDGLLQKNPSVCAELLRKGSDKAVASCIIERLAVLEIAKEVKDTGNLDEFLNIAGQNPDIAQKAQGVNMMVQRITDRGFLPFQLPEEPSLWTGKPNDAMKTTIKTGTLQDVTKPSRTTILEQHGNARQYFLVEEGILVILVAQPGNAQLEAYVLKPGQYMAIEPNVFHIAVNGTPNVKFYVYNEHPVEEGKVVKPDTTITCIGETFVIDPPVLKKLLECKVEIKDLLGNAGSKPLPNVAMAAI